VEHFNSFFLSFFKRNGNKKESKIEESKIKKKENNKW